MSRSKASAPTKLMCLIPELLPSSISILILTRLRGNSSIIVSMLAPYRPWATYCRSNSKLTLSRVACLKISPSLKPCSLRPSNNESVFIALLPSISIDSMAGRSTRLIIKTSLALSRLFVMSDPRPGPRIGMVHDCHYYQHFFDRGAYPALGLNTTH